MERMVTDSKTIEAIYRMSHEQKLSLREISRQLHTCRNTIKKYLDNPLPKPAIRKPRPSKLDLFKPVIRELLDQWPRASSVVIAQRIRPLGYGGGRSILQEYVATLRRTQSPPRAFVRVESSPGDRFEIDWGHFGALDYQGDRRKLYAFCCIECHSRRLYIEFTHSQCFETFVRCHIHAFQFMTGQPRECLYDNLATAVAEHDGRIVRFNPRFLAFAQEMGFYPRACNKAAGWEKGKIERGGVGYLRQNFWPLRTFTDLADVNSQVRKWLEEIANKRIHSETRQTPDERFRPECLRPLPPLIPDYCDTAIALVHKDIRLCFDGNRYCVPPRYVGCRLTVKADSQSIAIFDHSHEVARYVRCWRRGQTFGAERFEKELLERRVSADRSAAHRRLAMILGEIGESYLRGLAETDRSLTRQINELLILVREYGSESVMAAIRKAQSVGAFGADYIANILMQEQSAREMQPLLLLKDPRLNSLATDPLSLLDYDALILNSRSES
jgi:transposase